MNAKFAAEISQVDCDTEPLLNPFVHHLELNTTYEKIKTAIFTLILVPLRVGLICFIVVTGWMLATVGLFGVSDQELHEKPLEGWRKKLKNVICLLGRSSLMTGGMQFTIKGRQATREEAPILVVAPHSTFLDAGLVYVTGFPSTIVRTESVSFHIGKLINYTQPIYVWRDDPESRQKSVKEIISRATSKMDWPQILIFPEGTCTNRSCLISFKNGAFYPGVPIQPVCIRYPNKLDTVTWTWEGPSALKLLWLTLTQPSSHCEVEFLPVYRPSEEEKRDPKLFANNVRAVMAKALGIPVVDYTYTDCRMMTKAKEMNLPFASSLVEVRKLRRKLGLDNTHTEEKLLEASSFICRDCSRITFIEFVDLLRLQENEQVALQLFRIYDKNNVGFIDIRDYLLGVLATENNKSPLDVIRIAFKLYDTNHNGKLTAENVCKALCQTMGLSRENAMEIFDQVDRHQLGFVTYDNFVNYAQKKSEFSHLFIDEKSYQRTGEICPNNEKKID
ncbi:lysophosphatidylcholine acyltransferase isoform X2 [Rhynchophorus ferrugineus]|uniref:lysophosphatidylcholine acyltransferase isoform X2 n=1 Tax=Rhynchophorus ferrugineus TaxID=354439 RepID=UPI003FCD5254